MADGKAPEAHKDPLETLIEEIIGSPEGPEDQDSARVLALAVAAELHEFQDEALMEKALLDKNKMSKMFGRLLASGALESFWKWKESEEQRADPPDILITVTHAVGVILGGMLYRYVKSGHEKKAVTDNLQLLKTMIEITMDSHRDQDPRRRPPKSLEKLIKVMEGVFGADKVKVVDMTKDKEPDKPE